MLWLEQGKWKKTKPNNKEFIIKITKTFLGIEFPFYISETSRKITFPLYYYLDGPFFLEHCFISAPFCRRVDIIMLNCKL
jgi:hypothetical protein